MREFKKISLFLLILGFGFTSMVGHILAEDLPADSWLLPFDIGQRHKPTTDRPPDVNSQEDIYDFMWESFIALNWPQLENGNRAEPDTAGNLAPWVSVAESIESEGPVVWESYRRPSQVFTQPRFWPISWNDESPEELCLSVTDPKARIISSFSTNYSSNSNGLNQPFIQANYPTGFVVDQNGNYLRYEVGMNQSYFSYIKHFKYYVPRRQILAVKAYIRFVEKKGEKPPSSNNPDSIYFQQLPNGTETYLTEDFDLPEYALQGIVEWKAAWKILSGSDIRGRFYRRKAFFLNPDGSCTGPFLVGLVGFHIHRFTQFGHIGATFEHVDNTRLQPDYSSEKVVGAFDVPRHASLNPGGEVAPIYDNGYQVCDSEGNNCLSGFSGLIPKPIKDGDVLPLNPPIVNVSRQVGIPDDVQNINAKWRDRLQGTVWFYYQMIGTQNKNLNYESNPNLGPGTIGAQASNTNNLINTTLESYTQKGYSCALCHQNAFPLGVELPFPPFEEEFSALHTISFLLQNAKSNKGKSGLGSNFAH